MECNGIETGRHRQKGEYVMGCLLPGRHTTSTTRYHLTFRQMVELEHGLHFRRMVMDDLMMGDSMA